MIVPCKTLGNVKIHPNIVPILGKWNMGNGGRYTEGFDYQRYSKVFYIHHLESSPGNMTIQKFHQDFFGVLGSYLPANVRNVFNIQMLKPRHRSLATSTLSNAVKEASDSNSDLVIFLVPKANNARDYTEFKQLCDQDYGLKAVCMNVDKVLVAQGKGGNEWKGYVANVGMKINMKLGGTNHKVQGLAESGGGASKLQNTMILGADVTHPSPGSVEGTPSVAAVVGSFDADFTKFLGSMRRQAPRGVKQSEEVSDRMLRCSEPSD